MISSDEIEKITYMILELKKTKSNEQFEIIVEKIPEISEFKKNNKLLYKTILEDDFNMEIFKEMTQMKRRLEQGDDQYSVDVNFGKFMADKFVNPVVNK